MMPQSVGVFGAGFQAEFQLRVVDALTTINQFNIFDTNGERARNLATRLRPQLDADLTVSKDPETVASSDAILTVTNSKTPVLEESWLTDDTLVIALGSYRELPDDTISAADHLIVDDVEQCLQRGVLSDMVDRGEMTQDDLDATIGEVLVDDYVSTVETDDRILFVPIGMGSLDVALAEHIHKRKSEQSDAREFEFV